MQSIERLSGIFHGTIPDNNIRMVIEAVTQFVRGQLKREEVLKRIQRVLGDSDLTKCFERHIMTDYQYPKYQESSQNYNSKPTQTPDPLADSQPLTKTRGVGGTTCWTADEDRRLIEAVQNHNGRNWKAIAREVNPERTPDQCSQHWFRVLNPGIRKGKWSEEEDQMLLKIIHDIGTGSWKDIAAKMRGRTDIQVRYRYARLSKTSYDKGKRHGK